MKSISRIGALALAAAFAVAVPATAQQRPITIELNKIETVGAACRAYMMFENATDLEFEAFSVDLILFDRDGVIASRLAVDASPLRGLKTTVKVFEVPGVRCESLSRILVNDVLTCRQGGTERQDCIALVQPVSRTPVSLVR